MNSGGHMSNQARGRILRALQRRSVATRRELQMGTALDADVFADAVIRLIDDGLIVLGEQQQFSLTDAGHNLLTGDHGQQMAQDRSGARWRVDRAQKGDTEQRHRTAPHSVTSGYALDRRC